MLRNDTLLVTLLLLLNFSVLCHGAPMMKDFLSKGKGKGKGKGTEHTFEIPIDVSLDFGDAAYGTRYLTKGKTPKGKKYFPNPLVSYSGVTQLAGSEILDEEVLAAAAKHAYNRMVDKYQEAKPDTTRWGKVGNSPMPGVMAAMQLGDVLLFASVSTGKTQFAHEYLGQASDHPDGHFHRHFPRADTDLTGGGRHGEISALRLWEDLKGPHANYPPLGRAVAWEGGRATKASCRATFGEMDCARALWNAGEIRSVREGLVSGPDSQLAYYLQGAHSIPSPRSGGRKRPNAPEQSAEAAQDLEEEPECEGGEPVASSSRAGGSLEKRTRNRGGKDRSAHGKKVGKACRARKQPGHEAAKNDKTSPDHESKSSEADKHHKPAGSKAKGKGGKAKHHKTTAHKSKHGHH